MPAKIAAYWVDAESIEDTKERQGLPIYGVGKLLGADHNADVDKKIKLWYCFLESTRRRLWKSWKDYWKYITDMT